MKGVELSPLSNAPWQIFVHQTGDWSGYTDFLLSLIHVALSNRIKLVPIPLVTQHTLQSLDNMLWPARSPYLSPFEHVWLIIRRQPALPVDDFINWKRRGTPYYKIAYGVCITRYISVCRLAIKIVPTTEVISDLLWCRRRRHSLASPFWYGYGCWCLSWLIKRGCRLKKT